MMTYAGDRQGPTVIRYPRGSLPIRDNLFNDRESLGSVMIREGEEWALIGHGVTVHILLEAHEQANASGLPAPAVIDLRRLKPLDTPFLDEVLKNYPLVVVAEENYLRGGVGEALASRVAELGTATCLKRLGVPDRFIHHATIAQQREFCDLTVEGILNCAAGRLGLKACVHTA
jgi:1-deoxy-D-xylulose-5-phosphate synthase